MLGDAGTAQRKLGCELVERHFIDFGQHTNKLAARGIRYRAEDVARRLSPPIFPPQANCLDT
jgi:hypothetical protein